MHVSVHLYAGTNRGQKRVLDGLGLELEMVTGDQSPVL